MADRDDKEDAVNAAFNTPARNIDPRRRVREARTSARDTIFNLILGAAAGAKAGGEAKGAISGGLQAFAAGAAVPGQVEAEERARRVAELQEDVSVLSAERAFRESEPAFDFLSPEFLEQNPELSKLTLGEAQKLLPALQRQKQLQAQAGQRQISAGVAKKKEIRQGREDRRSLLFRAEDDARSQQALAERRLSLQFASPQETAKAGKAAFQDTFSRLIRLNIEDPKEADRIIKQRFGAAALPTLDGQNPRFASINKWIQEQRDKKIPPEQIRAALQRKLTPEEFARFNEQLNQ